MTDLPIVDVRQSPGGLTFTAAANGDTISTRNAYACELVVRVASGSVDVTLQGKVTCSQQSLHDTVLTCSAGDTVWPIPTRCIDVNGQATLTYSTVTGVSVAVLAVGGIQAGSIPAPFALTIGEVA